MSAVWSRPPSTWSGRTVMEAVAASRFARSAAAGVSATCGSWSAMRCTRSTSARTAAAPAPSRRASTAASCSSCAPSKREMFSRTTWDCDPGTSKPPLVRCSVCLAEKGSAGSSRISQAANTTRRRLSRNPASLSIKPCTEGQGYPGMPTATVTTVTIPTPHGDARAHLHAAAKLRGALVLGHGAGGGVEAPDLVAATEAAAGQGFGVARVEQPYRLAGRRSAPRAEHLDAAWIAVIEHLSGRELSSLPLVAGGRSAGARVACRTAGPTGAIAVLCLAFPLQPPPRKGKPPTPDRLHELEAVKVPVLVVQGEGDRFGMPPPGPNREVAQVPGDHSLRKDRQAVAAAVEDWLSRR